MSTAALFWPLAPRVTRATRTFPSVSLPTRGTRSPVRRVSNSLMGRRSILPTRRLRLERTTPSPVRWSK